MWFIVLLKNITCRAQTIAIIDILEQALSIINIWHEKFLSNKPIYD
jgi:hypothetical protein